LVGSFSFNDGAGPSIRYKRCEPGLPARPKMQRVSGKFLRQISRASAQSISTSTIASAPSQTWAMLARQSLQSMNQVCKGIRSNAPAA
jgi:hypothetical protein